jgi:ABC-type transport system involved in multi-copper enzyme maturation permease subunit
MKHIYLREIQKLLKDISFYIFIVIVICLAIFSGIVSSYNYSSINSGTNYIKATYENELKTKSKLSLQDAMETNHLAIKDSRSALFLAGSEAINYPNCSSIDINDLYFGNPYLYYPIKTNSSSVNFLKFIRSDMTFIIEVIFSFLIIVLVHNVISKEKENNTLRLILSNQIRKSDVLIGKFLGLLTVMIISIIIIVLVQLIIIRALGIIPIDTDTLSKVPLFILFSIFYACFWILLSTFISIVTEKSVVSLCYLLLVWVVFIFIIPSIGKIAVNYSIDKLPSSNEIEFQHQKYRNDLINNVSSQNASWRGGNFDANKRDNHANERKFSPIYEVYLEGLNKYHYSLASRRIDYLKFFYKFSSISPSFQFRSICESMTNFGFQREYDYLKSVQEFRESLMVNFKHIDYKDENSIHLSFLPGYMSNLPINPDLVPRFKEKKVSSFSLLTQNWLIIFIFLIESVILFLLSFVYFIRMDPR